MDASAGDDGGGPGQDPGRGWTDLAPIVTPTTFVAAIMRYFGAVRANSMYSRLGVDESLLGLPLPGHVLAASP